MIVDLDNASLLTVGQAARLLHLHPNTIRRWSKKGILKSYRINNRGDRRFKKEDINQLLFESWLFDYDLKSIEHNNELSVYA